jgi:hypothetical protein
MISTVAGSGSGVRLRNVKPAGPLIQTRCGCGPEALRAMWMLEVETSGAGLTGAPPALALKSATRVNAVSSRRNVVLKRIIFGFFSRFGFVQIEQG